MNGFTYEALANTFLSVCSSVKSFHLVPERSFSFVEFHDGRHALEAFRKIHGQVFTNQENSTPLYLAFVDAIPEAVLRVPRCNTDHPNGVQVIPNFVDNVEEDMLINSIAFGLNKSSDLKHRQVIHYGYDFVYGANAINPDKPNDNPFPKCWLPILERAVRQGLLAHLPDQCTVNKYEPGQGIPPHTDSHNCCDDTILSLSLCKKALSANESIGLSKEPVSCGNWSSIGKTEEFFFLKSINHV